MAVVCGECGKVYPIDPEMLKNYKGKSFRVKCEECGSLTQLKNMEEAKEELVIDFEEIADTRIPPADAEDAPDAFAEADLRSGFEDKVFIETPKISIAAWIRMSGKIFIPFILIPVILISVLLYLGHSHMNILTRNAVSESEIIFQAQGSERLMQKARDVAKQCGIYLRAHPDLLRGSFSYDPEFKNIAVQQFGKTGYTCLFQEPEPERGRGWIIWAHPKPEVIGNVEKNVMRDALGPHYDKLIELMSGVQGGKETSGTVKLLDPYGEIRPKKLAISPIANVNAPFFIMSIANVDEFSQKTDDVITHAENVISENNIISTGMLIFSILVIGYCIFIFGYRLTRNIYYLTNAANRISTGDLRVGINITSDDEIGRLAAAISRMQDSLRFSIERQNRR